MSERECRTQLKMDGGDSHEKTRWEAEKESNERENAAVHNAQVEVCLRRPLRNSPTHHLAHPCVIIPIGEELAPHPTQFAVCRTTCCPCQSCYSQRSLSYDTKNSLKFCIKK